ncbi:hypothetical protein [Vibrio sp. SCSIO 43137]|uniref:hypothetical protein n=1 Tax=Vibrio sp. SCSIO 43137 TaxID=3021011 RepID=UPI00230795C9|nr:hypothetical protein [Vibrio sp. SCSIO 43137]WCE28426.1 hypothetical protein PK654_08555 [Vibrio sp. SCSIO 43137]
MIKKENYIGFAIIAYVLIALLAIGGYVMNIYKALADTGGVDELIRVVGMVFPPIGAFMGYF